MSDKWNLIYEGVYENRSIQVEQYDDDKNCFKLISTQKYDEEGFVSQDESSPLIMTPTEAGRKIVYDCEGLSNLSDLIIEFEFNAETQGAVVERVRSNIQS